MNEEVIPDYLRDLFQRSCKNLSDDYHKEQLAKLLNEHSGAFAQDKVELGTCSLIKHNQYRVSNVLNTVAETKPRRLRGGRGKILETAAASWCNSTFYITMG